MKKQYLFLLLAFLLANCAAAQTISISGTVKTEQGDPLHLAFVQDKQYKQGVYTDSLGNFVLDVNPNSQLRISCQGFKGKVIDIDNKTSFAIVLQPAVNILSTKPGIPATVDPNSNVAEATLRDYIQLDQASQTIHDQANPQNESSPVTILKNGQTQAYTAPAQPKLLQTPTQPNIGGLGSRPQTYSGGVDMAQGAIFPQFTHKEETQGSRYLFTAWVHGFVINAKDSTIQSQALFFNYDKIGGNLLLSKDKHAAIEVFKESIKSFTLFDELNQPYTFTLVPEIDKTHFAQVITDGNNYKIYKLTKTEFIKSNYTSDGVASTGNNYDEYADENTYYVIGKSGAPQKITLKKKSLKEAFNGEANKLNQYLSTNEGDIDDNYLKDLGNFMNK